mmetsp:Transcript_37774/g.49666  ORF Transcript_37774/g.49666 Transcript_37774/m.49666 type:complete len:93 (-) Transcript_37774:33-311(-)
MIEKVGHAIMAAETMQVKICIRGDDECPELLKVELHSKSDFYFLYEHTCDVFDYSEMRDMQGLNPQFPDYLTVIIKLFTQAISEPGNLKCQV